MPGLSSRSFSIIIPALNEAHHLRELLPALRQAFPDADDNPQAGVRVLARDIDDDGLEHAIRTLGALR